MYYHFKVTECSVPRNITNGQRRYTSLIVGNKANYTCDEGYTLQDTNGTVTCGQDGAWSDTPTCSS